MRDDASLRRLAEMGVDVYVPRTLRAVVDVVSPVSAEASVAALPAMQKGPTPATVLLLAEGDSKAVLTLLADVTRTLGFARIACGNASVEDESAIAAAAALVMFGDGQARAVGALLPAQRQREMGWVVSAEPSQLAGNAQAKRALWSELKRMVRGLVSLAGSVAGDDHRQH